MGRGRQITLSRIWSVVSLSACLVGCDKTRPAEGPFPAKSPPVMISAAASTRRALEAITKEFEQTGQGQVRLQTGPTSGLANQILAGAPVEIFLSANQQWADAIEEAGLCWKRVPLLRNRLAIVVPAKNPANIQSPPDLLAERVTRIALAGEHVPAGEHAEQALRSLGLYEKLIAQGKIVRGHDVSVAVRYVEQNEVEAAITYVSDVQGSTTVQAVAVLPEDLHQPIVYHLLLLKSAEQNRPAQRFYDRLGDETAREVFLRFGFQPW